MSNKEDYEDGYRNGYWFGHDDAYQRGYEEGQQAEHDRIKRAIDSDSSENESSTLGSMIGTSITLTILGWCFAGLLSLLCWIGGDSDSWWFPWIWRIAFWGGIGFIVLMSIVGVAGTIMEQHEAKNPPEQPASDPKLPGIQTDDQDLWKKKYPIGDIKTIKEAETVKGKKDKSICPQQH